MLSKNFSNSANQVAELGGNKNINYSTKPGPNDNVFLNLNNLVTTSSTTFQCFGFLLKTRLCAQSCFIYF